MIYLDNAATTKIKKCVVNDMIPYLTDRFFNPGSSYLGGIETNHAVETARSHVASLIGAAPDQIIFTSGGSEANSLAIEGMARFMKEHNKNKIIVSSIEHDSVINASKLINQMYNINVEFAPVDKHGLVNIEILDNMITDDTGLVSVMHMNNEIGSVNDIQSIGKLCKKKNVIFHTDCVQSLGFMDINVDDIQCDLLSMSAHKINGPKGIGALYVRDKDILSPVISGGSGQEFGLRGGTENVAGIVGFGSACKNMGSLMNTRDSIISSNVMILATIRDRLEDYGLRDIFHRNAENMFDNIGKTVSVRFDGIEGETLVLALSNIGVYVSSGSACRGNRSDPNRVLQAIGLQNKDAMSSIRITPSENLEIKSAEDAGEYIAETVKDMINILNHMKL